MKFIKSSYYNSQRIILNGNPNKIMELLIIELIKS